MAGRDARDQHRQFPPFHHQTRPGVGRGEIPVRVIIQKRSLPLGGNTRFPAAGAAPEAEHVVQSSRKEAAVAAGVQTRRRKILRQPACPDPAHRDVPKRQLQASLELIGRFQRGDSSREKTRGPKSMRDPAVERPTPWRTVREPGPRWLAPAPRAHAGIADHQLKRTEGRRIASSLERSTVRKTPPCC